MGKKERKKKRKKGDQMEETAIRRE